jgi:hypothetical protein
VLAEFQQHATDDLGEGRAPAPTLGFLGRALDLGRVAQTQLHAIERRQQPTVPERIRVPPFLRPRSQRALHQLVEHLPRQAGAAAGAGTVVERVVEEQGEVFGQRAGVVHEVKDERGQEGQQGHARFASAARAQGGGEVTEQLLPGSEEAAVVGRSRGRRGFGFARASAFGFPIGTALGIAVGRGLAVATALRMGMFSHSHVESEIEENRKQIYLIVLTLLTSIFEWHYI